jgi:predicted acyl esterase
MTTLSEWFHEQEQEEQEEREAERRANLDEWRRIAKMLRDLEYIKVPVRRLRRVK